MGGGKAPYGGCSGREELSGPGLPHLYVPTKKLGPVAAAASAIPGNPAIPGIRRSL